jgi:hypothetical protein
MQGCEATNLQYSLSLKRMVFAARRPRRTTVAAGAGVSGLLRAWLSCGCSVLGSPATSDPRARLSSLDRDEPLPEAGFDGFRVCDGQGVLCREVLVNL